MIEKNYIELTILGEWISEQRSRAITACANELDAGHYDEYFKQLARYETLGNVAQFITSVPWKTLQER